MTIGIAPDWGDILITYLQFNMPARPLGWEYRVVRECTAFATLDFNHCSRPITQRTTLIHHWTGLYTTLNISLTSH